MVIFSLRHKIADDIAIPELYYDIHLLLINAQFKVFCNGMIYVPTNSIISVNPLTVKSSIAFGIGAFSIWDTLP
jgi:hypothetical protein